MDINKVLPINLIADQIQEAYSNNDVLVITGDPGSGKSTQIPQILWNLNPKPLIITQPRRLAAIEMSRRVDYEMKGEVRVNYTVRFEGTSTPQTQIHFVTDGVLLRLMLEDQLYNKYATIIIDEVHERTIFIDLILFLMKKHLAKTKGIKLVLMSATIDVSRYAHYFLPLKVAHIAIDNPRNFKLEIAYVEKSMNISNTIQEAVDQVTSIHVNEPFGDILVFLPGSEECLSAMFNCQKKLREMTEKGLAVPSVQMHVLFGSQAVQDQKLVFLSVSDELSTRKVIFATNIAETSLTIQNIAYVIDSGLIKQTHFSKETGTVQLKLGLISQAQAIQRAGRAGRTRDGKCIRLFSKYVFNEVMSKEAVPEIKRAELRSFIVMILGLGVTDFESKDFIDPPEQSAIRQAVEQLFCTGIIEISKTKSFRSKEAENDSSLEMPNKVVQKLPEFFSEEELKLHIKSNLMNKMIKNNSENNQIRNVDKITVEKDKIIYFQLTSLGKLSLKFPIDPLFVKAILLGKILKIESTLLFHASIMSTTENLMSQNFEDKKRYFKEKIKNADLDGDFFTFQKIYECNSSVFYQKAIENIYKIEDQLKQLLKNISKDSLEKCLRNDFIYDYFKNHLKDKEISLRQKLELCLKSSFPFYLAKKLLSSRNDYKLLSSGLMAILDSESVFEVRDEYPDFVIGTLIKGEGQVGVPVISDVYRVKDPSICFKYIDKLNELKAYEDKILWSTCKKNQDMDKNNESESQSQKLQIAKQKFLERKRIKDK